MSIRGRLTAMLLLAILPLVIAVGTGLYHYVRLALVARVDDGLLARARALSGMVRIEPDAIELDLTREAMPQYGALEGNEYFQIWTLLGNTPSELIQRSDSLRGGNLPSPTPDSNNSSKSTHPIAAWNSVLANGPGIRLAALRFTAHSDEPDEDEPVPLMGDAEVLVIVAQSRRELDQTLGLLAAALGGAGIILIGSMLLAMRFALTRGLAPINQLAAQVSTIGPETLSARVDSATTPRELLPITSHTNQLLDRLAAAFAREKRLAATAAHELRTPIAEIRSVTELALSRDRTLDEYRRTLATVLAASEQMGNATDAILRLARVQSGREKVDLHAVDLIEAVLPAWQRWIAPLGVRGTTIAMNIPQELQVLADARMLAVAIENLCANIAEHTPSNGDVKVSLVEDHDDRVTLTLTNTLALSADLLPYASYQPTNPHGVISTHPQHIHTGLGLSIARSMIEACGGTIDTAADPDHFSATVNLARARKHVS